MARLWTVGLVLGFVACSGSAVDSSNKDGDADTDADADTDTDTDTDTDSDADTDFDPIPNCTQSCNTAADCDLGSSAYDSDNYDCVSGACEWTGCNSDAECEATMSGWVCTTALSGLDYCAMGCNTAADCDLGSAPYDADNYECVSGACEWTDATRMPSVSSVFDPTMCVQISAWPKGLRDGVRDDG